MTAASAQRNEKNEKIQCVLECRNVVRASGKAFQCFFSHSHRKRHVMKTKVYAPELRPCNVSILIFSFGGITSVLLETSAHMAIEIIATFFFDTILHEQPKITPNADWLTQSVTCALICRNCPSTMTQLIGGCHCLSLTDLST